MEKLIPLFIFLICLAIFQKLVSHRIGTVHVNFTSLGYFYSDISHEVPYNFLNSKLRARRHH